MYASFPFEQYSLQLIAGLAPSFHPESTWDSKGSDRSQEAISPQCFRLDDPHTPVLLDSMVANTRRKARTLGAIQNEVPLEYASRNSLHAKLNLKAEEWSIPMDDQQSADLRMVYIDGGKNRIVNTWIFPNHPERTPVYAAEIIAVGSEIRVAFIDIQVPALSQERVGDVFAVSDAVSSRYTMLPCDQPPPHWAIQDSAGAFTYARNVPCQSADVIENCYFDYLDSYCKFFLSEKESRITLDKGHQEQALQRLHEYQKHHQEHSPGNKYLSKLFGADWTIAFMENFLFRIPGRS